jgi:phosphoglycolate phosphatase
VKMRTKAVRSRHVVPRRTSASSQRKVSNTTPGYAAPVSIALLWDIDGTLLTTARAGVFAVQEAVYEVCQAGCDLDGIRTAGLTDYQVMEVAIRRAGLDPATEDVTAVLRSYERRLPLALFRRTGRVLPFVREILDDLEGREGVVSLLLTGNTCAAGTAKLLHYGLKDYFPGRGAFCEGPGAREEIASRAHALVRSLLGRSPAKVFVIGDSPADVRCGKAIGADTVAVATGPHQIEDLERQQPWRVMAELPDPAGFRHLIGVGDHA